MLKQSIAGIDVSAKKLDVAVEFDAGRREQRVFDNDASGHKKLRSYLTQRKRSSRVVVESTGIYSLDLALALSEVPSIEVMVANPRALKDFARASMVRSKSDAIDAASILEYAKCMPFVAWDPPSAVLLELRSLSRRIASLSKDRAREKNRLHAAQASEQGCRFVINDIEVNIRHIDRRIDGLTNQAVRVVQKSGELEKRFDQLVSITGVATYTAVQVLPELLLLPADMSAKQWVAYAGLDPRVYESGSSVSKPARISRVGSSNLRRSLYLPALSAVTHEPNVREYYQRLLGRGKKPMQAQVAVMRKLLHAIHGMFRSGQCFDGEKFTQTA